MIDVSIEQNRSTDWGMSRYAIGCSRTQFRGRFDLRAQVGRSSEKEPVLGVSADRDLGLGSGFSVKCSDAHCTAIRAGAIPLGEASASGRAENFDLHGGKCSSAWAIPFLEILLVGNSLPPPPVRWNQRFGGKIRE